MRGRFSDKLGRLSETASLALASDATALGRALDRGRARHSIAIGSGGSTIAAEYFARCRETLFAVRTFVETPMQFVLGASRIDGCDIWLFSASSDNSDVLAAAETAIKRRAAAIHLVTRNPQGMAALKVISAGGEVHAVPVAEEKDGYLATHSLVGTTAVLLQASDLVSGEPVGADLATSYLAGVQDRLSTAAREMVRSRFQSLRRDDTLLLLADPQARPISTLIDTSFWEAGICPVQATDFRNFAHGRHSWVHQRGESSILLALTGQDSRDVWHSLRTSLPGELRQIEIDFGRCGRLANALGIVDALVLVEAAGDAVAIDPGRPSIGPYAREIYESAALQTLASTLPPPLDHKRSAVLRHDHPSSQHLLLKEARRDWLSGLSDAVFGGIVLDYDGTIVRTTDRYSPPEAAIVAELERLVAGGLKIAIATGRGNSAGKDLRSVLPKEIYGSVTVGYYNGGYIRTLDVDIKVHRPPADADIDEAIEWLGEHKELFAQHCDLEGGVQVTLQHSDLKAPETFAFDIASCPPLTDRRVLLTCSAHSFDLIPASTTKLSAVKALTADIAEGLAVLCVGDSGSRNGNDYAILTTPYGISVGDVCGSANGCWSFFGDHLLGPDALLELLRALRPFGSQGMKIDVASLTLGRDWA